jgi:WD40 repeat protein
MKNIIFIIFGFLLTFVFCYSQNQYKKTQYDDSKPLNPFDTITHKYLKPEIQNRVYEISKSPAKNMELNKSYLGWEGYYGKVTCIAYNNDGTLLVSGGEDGTIRIWDTKTGNNLRVFAGHSDPVKNIFFSSDGKKICSGEERFILKFWDVEKGELISTTPYTNNINESTGLFSPDGSLMYLTKGNNEILVYDVYSAREVKKISAKGYVKNICISPDNSKLIWLSNGIPEMINIAKDSITSNPIGTYYLDSFEFSSSGTELIGYHNQEMIIWSIEKDSISKYHFDYNIFSAYYSTDKKEIAYNSDDGVVIRMLESDSTFLIKKRNLANIRKVRFSTDGLKISIISNELEGYRMSIWNIRKDSLICDLSFYYDSPILISPDWKYVSTILGNSIQLQNIENSSLNKTIYGHTGWTISAVFSPDGKKLATVGNSETKIWDTKNANLLTSISNIYGEKSYSSAFTPDGYEIAFGGNYEIEIRNVNNGSLIKNIWIGSAVPSVAFSPDGKILAAGSKNKNITLWNTSDWSLLKTLTGHEYEVYFVRFSPDGKKLVSSAENGAVIVWNIETGDQLMTLSGLKGWVFNVAYTPDGTKIIAGDATGKINIWNANDGTILRTITSECTLLNGCSNVVYSTAISPDGNKIAAGFLEGKIKIWNIKTLTISDSIIFDQGFPFSICYNNDGSRLASVGLGYKNIRIYYLNEVKVVPPGNELPVSNRLEQNYPNPFNPSTKIQFVIGVHNSGITKKKYVTSVQIKLYDILGREIKTIFEGKKEAGYHTIEFNAGNLPAGTYFCVMRTDEERFVKKLLLLR